MQTNYTYFSITVKIKDCFCVDSKKGFIANFQEEDAHVVFDYKYKLLNPEYVLVKACC